MEPSGPIRIAGHVVQFDRIVAGEVVVHDGQVVEVRAAPDASGVDGRWIVPGFIETQINGTHGIDLGTEPERAPEVARHLLAEGITSYLPTVTTGPAAIRDRAVDVLGGAVRRARVHHAGQPVGADADLDADLDAVRRAVPIGVHLEGPVLSPTRRGAHPAEYLATPDQCDTSRWTAADGVAMVTLAPEVPGALTLIARLRVAGVAVSVGHTDAPASEVLGAIDAGASHITHLFNAMRPFGHRDPGPIGAVLVHDAVTAGLIADGLHVDPLAVALAWRMLGPDRTVLVTDAVAARGTGSFREGVRTVDGVLAGSVVTLDEALRNLVAWCDVSIVDAVRTVTATPARVLGRTDLGRIEVGARADLTVLDEGLRVRQVFVGGSPVDGGR